MLSEDEKKAIEYAKNCLMKITMGLDVDFDVNILDKLLNIIYKLQKENDILKNHVHYKKCQKCEKEFRTKRNDAKYCDKCKKDGNKEWYKNLTEEQKKKRREQAKISMRKIRERRKTI